MYASVELNDGDFTQIDFEDISLFEGKTLTISRNGYVAFSQDGKTMLLHRAIMKPPKGLVVDHINGDRKDNRRENLRVCTYIENQSNIHYYPKHSVQLVKGRWQATVQINKIRNYLGRHDTKEEAIEAVKSFKEKVGKLTQAQSFHSSGGK